MPIAKMNASASYSVSLPCRFRVVTPVTRPLTESRRTSLTRLLPATPARQRIGARPAAQPLRLVHAAHTSAGCGTVGACPEVHELGA